MDSSEILHKPDDVLAAIKQSLDKAFGTYRSLLHKALAADMWALIKYIDYNQSASSDKGVHGRTKDALDNAINSAVTAYLRFKLAYNDAEAGTGIISDLVHRLLDSEIKFGTADGSSFLQSVILDYEILEQSLLHEKGTSLPTFQLTVGRNGVRQFVSGASVVEFLSTYLIWREINKSNKPERYAVLLEGFNQSFSSDFENRSDVELKLCQFLADPENLGIIDEIAFFSLQKSLYGALLRAIPVSQFDLNEVGEVLEDTIAQISYSLNVKQIDIALMLVDKLKTYLDQLNFIKQPDEYDVEALSLIKQYLINKCKTLGEEFSQLHDWEYIEDRLMSCIKGTKEYSKRIAATRLATKESLSIRVEKFETLKENTKTFLKWISIPQLLGSALSLSEIDDAKTKRELAEAVVRILKQAENLGDKVAQMHMFSRHGEDLDVTQMETEMGTLKLSNGKFDSDAVIIELLLSNLEVVLDRLQTMLKSIEPTSYVVLSANDRVAVHLSYERGKIQQRPTQNISFVFAKVYVGDTVYIRMRTAYPIY